MKVGFLEFSSDLFQQLARRAAEKHFSEDSLKDVLIAVTRYTNELLNFSRDSVEYEINVISYEDFEGLYISIHEEIPLERIPLYNIAGVINLKDFEVSGYITFSLPKQFIANQTTGYTLKQFLINAAHERFERFLAKKTIIAQVYERAREDYHNRYTLDKEKNVAAFLLYALNKDLTAIQETITYAVSHLVEEFVDTNYTICNHIFLPLIDRPFSPAEKKVTEMFKITQLKRAQVNRSGSDLAKRRITAGLRVLSFVTEKFPKTCQDFLETYPRIKSQLNPAAYDFTATISSTIQLILQNHGLADLMQVFNQELAKL